MKIGLDTAPAALRGTYFQHLASVLARYAPEHEYVIGAEVNDGVDLYHGFRSSLPLSVHLRRVPSVMTVPNLNFPIERLVAFSCFAISGSANSS